MSIPLSKISRDSTLIDNEVEEKSLSREVLSLQTMPKGCTDTVITFLDDKSKKKFRRVSKWAQEQVQENVIMQYDKEITDLSSLLHSQFYRVDLTQKLERIVDKIKLFKPPYRFKESKERVVISGCRQIRKEEKVTCSTQFSNLLISFLDSKRALMDSFFSLSKSGSLEALLLLDHIYDVMDQGFSYSEWSKLHTSAVLSRNLNTISYISSCLLERLTDEEIRTCHLEKSHLEAVVQRRRPRRYSMLEALNYNLYANSYNQIKDKILEAGREGNVDKVASLSEKIRNGLLPEILGRLLLLSHRHNHLHLHNWVEEHPKARHIPSEYREEMQACLITASEKVGKRKWSHSLKSRCIRRCVRLGKLSFLRKISQGGFLSRRFRENPFIEDIFIQAGFCGSVKIFHWVETVYPGKITKKMWDRAFENALQDKIIPTLIYLLELGRKKGWELSIEGVPALFKLESMIVISFEEKEIRLLTLLFSYQQKLYPAMRLELLQYTLRVSLENQSFAHLPCDIKKEIEKTVTTEKIEEMVGAFARSGKFYSAIEAHSLLLPQNSAGTLGTIFLQSIISCQQTIFDWALTQSKFIILSENYWKNGVEILLLKGFKGMLKKLLRTRKFTIEEKEFCLRKAGAEKRLGHQDMADLINNSIKERERWEFCDRLFLKAKDLETDEVEV